MGVFIGLGPNPNEGELDMPLGFGMELFQNTDAYDYFSSLDKQKRNDVIKHIQGSTTGDEAKNRIISTVNELKSHNTNFLS